MPPPSLTSPLIDAPLIDARDLCLRRGGRRVIDGASLQIGAGVTVLRGANGSGKSTLLRAFAGILHRAGGTVSIAGYDLDRAPEAARAQLGYVPETPDLFPYLTPRELLSVIVDLRGGTLEQGIAVMVELGLEGREDQRVATLSLGQRRKVTIAAAACGEPRVLLLDEPFNGLDVAALAALHQLLRGWRGEGRAVVVATHDLAPLRGLEDRVCVVRSGRVEESAPERSGG